MPITATQVGSVLYDQRAVSVGVDVGRNVAGRDQADELNAARDRVLLRQLDGERGVRCDGRESERRKPRTRSTRSSLRSRSLHLGANPALGEPRFDERARGRRPPRRAGSRRARSWTIA